MGRARERASRPGFASEDCSECISGVQWLRSFARTDLQSKIECGVMPEDLG